MAAALETSVQLCHGLSLGENPLAAADCASGAQPKQRSVYSECLSTSFIQAQIHSRRALDTLRSKTRDEVECFLKQSLNGAILLEGCRGPAARAGEHRAPSSTCISGWVTLSPHNGIPQLHAGRGFMQAAQGLRFLPNAHFKRCISGGGDVKSFMTVGGRKDLVMVRKNKKVEYGSVLLFCHLQLVFTPQVQQLCLSSMQSCERNHKTWDINFKKKKKTNKHELSPSQNDLPE